MAAFTFQSNIISGITSYNNVNINAVSGYTPDEYDLVVKRYGFYDNGGTYTTQRSAWSLAGYTGANTAEVNVTNTLTQRVYFKATGTTNYEVSGWTTPAMTTAGDEVCNGTATRSSGGTVTLSAANTSGLTGSFTVAANATNDTWYIDIVIYHDRYDGDVDGASNNILGFLILEDLDDSSENAWKVAEAGTIVDFDELITEAGVDNVADVFKRNTLRNQLIARGWLN
jgi:hypothetical protein